MLLRFHNLIIEHAEYLYLIIPLAIITFLITIKKYVRDDLRMVRQPGKKILALFFTILILSMLILAIASPYLENNESMGNIEKIKVLIDNSYSMKLYDISSIEQSISKITDKGISVDMEKIDLGDYSSIGNSVLNNLAPGEDILLISDGQNNFGPNLEDVSLLASSMKSRIFGISLQEKKDDARISIEGPSKVVSGVENTYTVTVDSAGEVGRKNVKVYVDNQLEYDKIYAFPVEIKKTFQSGNHFIKAVLETTEKDLFPDNNAFYKTVMVYPKPKILFATNIDSPLSQLYSNFYSLDITNTIPPNLSGYYSIVLDNINAAALKDYEIELLDSYVSDGNGLFVIGGKNSYDWGDYNTSSITNLLPVAVGKAKKKPDVTNIVILMDTGASAGELLDNKSDISYIDLQKSVAADIIRSLSGTNKVGIIEANYYLNTITGLSEVGQKRDELITDIAKLKSTGFSELRFAYQKAYEMLRLTKGSRNIVLITDGNVVPQDQAITLQEVAQAHDDGIKTFVIGVRARNNEDLLQNIKTSGEGEYFKINEQTRIKLYFGNPEENPSGELSLFVYDSNHFITKNLLQLGTIYGFNGVYPKSTARLLLTTSKGDPILTIWNYGLGRVAALTTDDGGLWVPDLLKEQNSKVLIRALNWLIEDPERKNDFKIEIPELRQGENAVIKVKSTSLPQAETEKFYEIEKNLYQANYFPNETGFTDILGVPAAVNYKKEYLNLGIDSEFARAIAISGGEILQDNPDMIADKLKTLTPVASVRKVYVSWMLVCAALVIYLIELFIRRVYELKQPH